MGVSKQISSFTIPLGATINMDGTSIMQGVAVIFIAEAYGIHLTPANLATVVVTATLASIGTAGIPSVGLVTLAMVLNSVGLPTEGIALIMGIDRILDMLRTAVNITGDAVCTTIISHQEKALNREVFNRNEPLTRLRKALFRHAYGKKESCKLQKRVPVFGNSCGFRRERVFLISFLCYSSNAWRMLS